MTEFSNPRTLTGAQARVNLFGGDGFVASCKPHRSRDVFVQLFCQVLPATVQVLPPRVHRNG